MQRDIRRLLQWLSIPGRSVDVDLHIIGILVQVEAITGDNEAQLSCVYTPKEDTTVGPVWILTGPQTAPAAICCVLSVKNDRTQSSNESRVQHQTILIQKHEVVEAVKSC